MSASILSKYIRPEVLSRIDHLNFKPRQLVEGHLSGEHQSPRHGFAVEFAGHREYTPGDDLRHLDWNVYYRHERLVVKQYVMETNLDCHLWLDVSASMRYGEGGQQKSQYASRMLSTLAYLILGQSDRISFAAYDEALRVSIPVSNAMSQLIRVTQELEHMEVQGKTEAKRAMLELSEGIGRRGVVMIFSDFFMDLEDLKQVIQRLKAARHEVVLFQVMHGDELDFRLDGMVRFEGLESDEVMTSRPEDIRRQYLDALDRFNSAFEELCEAHSCERVLCSTQRSLGELFADYLRQRSVSQRRG